MSEKTCKRDVYASKDTYKYQKGEIERETVLLLLDLKYAKQQHMSNKTCKRDVCASKETYIHQKGKMNRETVLLLLDLRYAELEIC